MAFVDKYSKAFRALLPTPFTIAISLTVITFCLAFFWPNQPAEPVLNIEHYKTEYTVTSDKNITWSNGSTDDTLNIESLTVLKEITGSYTNPSDGYNSKISFRLKDNLPYAVVTTQSKGLQILDFWYNGLWGQKGLSFAIQMMLMLLLGHVLALSSPVNSLLNRIVPYCDSTAKAALIVTLLTLIASWFNWGLGLIFGAVFARKVGEYAMVNAKKINYALIGAAGYAGLMIWHGGISGSSLIKISEEGHFKELITKQEILDQLPSSIGFSETVFSSMNITITLSLFMLLPFVMYLIGKRAKPTKINIPVQKETEDNPTTLIGAEKIDHSFLFVMLLGLSLVGYSIYLAVSHPGFTSLKFINPNYINFLLLGLASMFHGSIIKFLKGVDHAISGVSGILIQFPLYFGIMGIMSNSGMINDIAQFFQEISNEVTYPLYTLISAGIVNIFVPSGGGQWYVQGPIVLQTAVEMKIPIAKSIMALAYGDQLTNMLQPFWALPLLGITGLKAKDILPYTLILMLVGLIIFSIGLLVF